MLAALAVVLVLPAVLSRPAQAQDEPPIYLGGNPIVQQDRIQLLREEARERQREIKEAKEAAKEARNHKHAKGRHAEVAPLNDDAVSPGALLAHPASSTSVVNALVAPLNTRANNKLGDSIGNFTAGEAEQSIAFLGQNGLCAWNDGRGFYHTPQDVQGYGYTTNGGATWTDGGTPLKQGTISTWSSDPVVTVNEKTGYFYYCGLTTNTGSNNGVGVARGHFSGSSFVWDAATVVASGSNASFAFDKEWMCADSLTGNLYVTWTRFTTTGDAIWFARSTDNGATWGAAIQISVTAENGLVSGSRPVVGPNGEVYVVYNGLGSIDADNMKIAKSTNNGVSFSSNVVAGTTMDNYFTGAPGFNRGRAINFPAVAVDRSNGVNRGRIYMTYQSAVNFYGDGLGSGTVANEVENNGNFGNATPFTINQTLRGAIAAADIDNWKFPATQGTTYVFYVDSLRTSSFKYTMRLYCPNDTVSVSRLALSSDGSSSSSVNVHALIVWTCPATNTYYLRMQNSTSTGGYRIRTGVHTPVGSDGGRDQRDCVVVSSPNGTSTWTAPVRINDDLPYYDDWLPEIAVPSDGIPYAIWFDWRDTPASCFGGSNIYMTRSLDAGATWAASQVATTAVTANWTQVASNIAPNEGDYNALYGGDCLALSWADGRLGDADIYTARMLTTFTAIAGSDGAADAGTMFNLTDQVSNASVMWPVTVNYALSGERSWPGLPATGVTTVPAGSAGSLPFGVNVPDSAAAGVVKLCLTATLPNGALSSSCCVNLTVNAGPTGVGDGPRAELALHAVRPNPGSGPLSVSFSLPDGSPATLSLVDLGGRQVLERPVGDLGPGFHVVRLDEHLPAGIYLVRLSQGGRTRTTKAAILR
jgi:hypothetical protein